MLGDVVLQQPLGEEDAEPPRGRLRHLVGIDAVEVLARGIGVRVADGLAAVPRRDVAAGERVQQMVELDPRAPRAARRTGLVPAFRLADCDAGPKTILGRTRPFDARSAVRWLAFTRRRRAGSDGC